MANEAQGQGFVTPFPGLTIYPMSHDNGYPSALCLEAWCTGVPTDTTANRYAPGCVIIRTDAPVGGPYAYTNVGTTAVPVFSSSGLGLQVAHAVYSFAVDGGAVSTITPINTANIPNNAIIVGGTINSTTAVTTGTTASLSVGVSAGLSPTTTKLLGATPTGSFSTDALINATPTFAAPVKMTAAGNITFTVTGAALTAGIVEAFVYYTVALNA